VHQAKGSEFERVLFVIPPDTSGSRSKDLLANWESGNSPEQNRVAYVALTRAKRFLAIAVPAKLASRLQRILSRGEVPLDVVEI